MKKIISTQMIAFDLISISNRYLAKLECGHSRQVNDAYEVGDSVSCRRCDHGRARDSQRSKVYDSENGLRHLGRDIRDFEVTRKYVKKVLDSPWTQRTWNIAPGHFSRVRIKDGRGTRTARGGKFFLNLPTWARTELVVLHELAHMMVHYDRRNDKLAAHGREFCMAFLALVRHFMGREVHDKLKANFKANKVRYTKKKVLSPEHRAKLREHGRQLAAARWKDKKK